MYFGNWVIVFEEELFSKVFEIRRKGMSGVRTMACEVRGIVYILKTS